MIMAPWFVTRRNTRAFIVKTVVEVIDRPSTGLLFALYLLALANSLIELIKDHTPVDASKFALANR